MDHRGDRSLAVGTRYVNGCECPLGMSKRRAEPGDVVEPELDSKRFECEEAFDQVRRYVSTSTVSAVVMTGGSSGLGSAPMKRSVLASTLFIERRSTMRSTIP